jgi:hypothetical protein
VSIRLLEARLRGLAVEARIPFRYGIAELRKLLHVFLFATMEVDGRRQVGVAADNLPPKWFTKDPATSYREDAGVMIGVIESAAALAREAGSVGSVFELWRRVERELAARRSSELPPILAAFGASVVERAAIDAFCRAKAVPFAEAVRRNDLGIQLGTLHPELRGREPNELLPRYPLGRVTIRHTVGLGDALLVSDGPSAAADGLPSSLEDCIARYGLRRFKVKVRGEPEADLDRLERIASMLDSRLRGAYRLTIDGNEQFGDVPALQAFWNELAARRGTAELARRVDYVEQPLPRELALAPETAARLAEWPARPCLIIDESDDSVAAVARAIEAGYDGGAFKSSKGVFKGVGNACLVEHLRREDPQRRLVYSAEDASTIGPVGLLADLAVIATLGIDEPERNGYHYLTGGTGLSRRVDEETIRCHGDLFASGSGGHPVLEIRDGGLDLGSIVAAPFGVGWSCDFEDELAGARSLLDEIA